MILFSPMTIRTPDDLTPEEIDALIKPLCSISAETELNLDEDGEEKEPVVDNAYVTKITGRTADIEDGTFFYHQLMKRYIVDLRKRFD